MSSKEDRQLNLVESKMLAIIHVEPTSVSTSFCKY